MLSVFYIILEIISSGLDLSVLNVIHFILLVSIVYFFF